jgi:hypothetical protein
MSRAWICGAATLLVLVAAQPRAIAARATRSTQARPP